ncbi:hypothetical protein [Quadrisphaera sp. KR29]|uniref:hypothetical protein n=1 Tax=Quadrisphaera sp. KR29 TaxID=3461391 RepID=UPI0040443E86
MNAATPTRSTTRSGRPSGLAATFEDERYSWTRRRPTRRAAVVAEVVLLLAMAAAAVATAHSVGSVPAFVVVWVVGFLAFIPLHAVVNLGVRGVFDRRETTLDEVQRTMRDASTAAVQPLRVGLGLVAVVAAVALAVDAPVPTQGYALGFVLWFVTWLLSTWHLAWTLPEED